MNGPNQDAAFWGARGAAMQYDKGTVVMAQLCGVGAVPAEWRRKTTLQAKFGDFGQILRIEIPEGQARAYIQYEDKRDAEDAVADLNHSSIAGRQITCEIATGKEGGSTKVDVETKVEELARKYHLDDGAVVCLVSVFKERVRLRCDIEKDFWELGQHLASSNKPSASVCNRLADLRAGKPIGPCKFAAAAPQLQIGQLAPANRIFVQAEQTKSREARAATAEVAGDQANESSDRKPRGGSGSRSRSRRDRRRSRSGSARRRDSGKRSRDGSNQSPDRQASRSKSKSQSPMPAPERKGTPVVHIGKRTTNKGSKKWKEEITNSPLRSPSKSASPPKKATSPPRKAAGSDKSEDVGKAKAKSKKRDRSEHRSTSKSRKRDRSERRSRSKSRKRARSERRSRSKSRKRARSERRSRSKSRKRARSERRSSSSRRAKGRRRSGSRDRKQRAKSGKRSGSRDRKQRAKSRRRSSSRDRKQRAKSSRRSGSRDRKQSARKARDR